MKPLTSGRMPLLLLGLAATLVALLLAPPPADEVVAPAPRDARALPSGASATTAVVTAAVAAAPGEEEVLRLRPRGAAAGSAALFDVAAVPMAVVAPPLPEFEIEAAPVLPPLPFRVLGLYEEGGVLTVFLDDNGEGHAVKAGATLRNDTYRIDAISNDAVQFTYLPLHQKQTLALGETP